MFTHLHVHTEYSLLDGVSRIPLLVKRAEELGMDSLAITDHGSLYGVVEFYTQCKESGIKPIIGCEVYVARTSRHTKDPSERSPFHLTVLARNNSGYKNLINLVSLANLEGHYYKPRIDKELLQIYHEGLIVLSGCPSGEIPRLISEGRIDEAKETAIWYKNLFGEDGFYFELQHHEHVEGLQTINDTLSDISSELGIPLVLSNDCHYVDKVDASIQDVLICIHTNTTLQDEKRLKMEDDSYYLKSALEMADLFPNHKEAMSNTIKIAELCNVTLSTDELHLPSYPVPQGTTPDEYLKSICLEGYKKLYPDPGALADQRLEYELDVIKSTQFANYFLVVWDIVSFAREKKIMFGVRGSAAASLVLYCLGVTEIDPLEYTLVFERFLNVERKEMPDIDMDFQDDRRDEVLMYVTNRYGSDKVAQIITFGTLGAKASLRDVGRALGMAYSEVDQIAQLVPFKCRTLDDALKISDEMRTIYESDESVTKLIDTARSLEGTVSHVSTHAAGVVISSNPLTEYVPLQRPVRNDTGQIAMTQYPMDAVAMLGLLKIDFLGLTSLTILDRTIKLLYETKDINIDLHSIPLDDKKTFDLLSSGKTTDIFQLESSGMQRYIKELKPSSIGDIAAMIALYRPGPMEHISTFIDAKHGRKAIQYPHPVLKDILEETYGVIVYQDQVLLILQTFAGYSLGQADKVRKAMGKKIVELMKPEREKFIHGATIRDFDSGIAETVFDLIEPFAGYAFNKAHSVSYALISYWTAYFKANFPREYMTSVLNSRLDHPDRMSSAITECFRMGIPVLLPDLNRSHVYFTLDQDADSSPGIRFGLAAIKNAGETAISPIVQERSTNGPFVSLDEFCVRADLRGLNKRTLDSLIKAGTFDAFGNRATISIAGDQILALSQKEAQRKASGQTSMFDVVPEVSEHSATINLDLDGPQATLEENCAWERELLGVVLSHNITELLASIDTSGSITSISDLDTYRDGQRASLVGQLSDLSERYTRHQRPYMIGNLALAQGNIEIIAWPDILKRTRSIWGEGTIIKAEGKFKMRGDNPSLHCENVMAYKNGSEVSAGSSTSNESPAILGANNASIVEKLSNTTISQPINPENNAGKTSSGNVLISFVESSDTRNDADILKTAISTALEYQGVDQLRVEIISGEKRVLIEFPMVTTKFCPELEDRLKRVLEPHQVQYIAT